MDRAGCFLLLCVPELFHCVSLGDPDGVSTEGNAAKIDDDFPILRSLSRYQLSSVRKYLDSGVVWSLRSFENKEFLLLTNKK